eukprot:9425982-Pyramimonas_sp.AAC.1
MSQHTCDLSSCTRSKRQPTVHKNALPQIQPKPDPNIETLQEREKHRNIDNDITQPKPKII